MSSKRKLSQMRDVTTAVPAGASDLTDGGPGGGGGGGLMRPKTTKTI